MITTNSLLDLPAYEYLLAAADGPVGIVTLNNPRQRNALTAPLMLEVADALERFEASAMIHALVLTGGDEVFAAGGDLKQLVGASAADMLRMDRHATWDRIRRLSKPIIAAVAGYALGGGCELAMQCDLIVAAETARFGQPEINVGLMPGAGGTQRLTRAQRGQPAWNWTPMVCPCSA